MELLRVRENDGGREKKEKKKHALKVEPEGMLPNL